MVSYVLSSLLLSGKGWEWEWIELGEPSHVGCTWHYVCRSPSWQLVDQGVNGLRIVNGILCALLSPPSDWGKGVSGSWIEGCGLMLLIPSWLFVVQGGSGWLIPLSGIFVCLYYILKAFGAYALIELSPPPSCGESVSEVKSP